MLRVFTRWPNLTSISISNLSRMWHVHDTYHSHLYKVRFKVINLGVTGYYFTNKFLKCRSIWEGILPILIYTSCSSSLFTLKWEGLSPHPGTYFNPPKNSSSKNMLKQLDGWNARESVSLWFCWESIWGGVLKRVKVTLFFDRLKKNNLNQCNKVLHPGNILNPKNEGLVCWFRWFSFCAWVIVRPTNIYSRWFSKVLLLRSDHFLGGEDV